MNRLLISVLVAHTVGCSAEPHSPGREGGESRAQSAAPAESNAVSQLALALPQWDPVALMSASSDNYLSHQGASRLQQIGAKGEFREVLARANGRLVERNEDNHLVKHDISRGYWKFLGDHSTPQAEGEGMSEEQAKLRTFDLFASAGLAASEVGHEVVTSVLAASSDGTSSVVARHVRLIRNVGGLRVWDSHFMATYALDGRPFRVETKWPRFALPAVTDVASPEEVAEIIVSTVGSPDVSQLKTRLTYAYDEVSLTHYPALMIGWPSHTGEEVLSVSLHDRAVSRGGPGRSVKHALPTRETSSAETPSELLE